MTLQNMQASGCPFHQKDGGQTSLASTNNSDWWPNALNLGHPVATR